MVDSTEGPEAEALVPVAVRSTSPRRRRALWGALAVLAVAAGTLAVVANDDGGSSPRLPIALGSGGAETKSAAPAGADMAIYAPFHYVAGDDLPLLGDSGPAYKLPGTVDDGDVARLADALHLTGTPKHEDGVWRLTSDAGTLEVYEGGGGTWWYSNAKLVEPDYGTNDGSDACPPDAKECATVGGSTTVPAAGSGSSSGGGSASSPVVDQPTTDCGVDKCIDPVEPEPFVPPADLPSKDEARQIALDLFRTIGTPLGDPTVTVDGPYDSWYVSIEPTVDGLAASGLYFNASVGSKGEITSAGGMLNTPERLGDYPVVDTRAAIDRLNDGIAYGGARDTAAGTVSSGSGESGPMTTSTTGSVPATVIDPPDAVAPIGPSVCNGGLAVQDLPTTTVVVDPAQPVPSPECEPYVPPEPVDVVLHQADRVLVLIAANDGSTDAYLVPGYRFHGDQDTVVDVPAVDDDSLLPTPDPGETPVIKDTVPFVEPPTPETTLAEG
jgi:hypothetical protein